MSTTDSVVPPTPSWSQPPVTISGVNIGLPSCIPVPWGSVLGMFFVVLVVFVAGLVLLWNKHWLLGGLLSLLFGVGVIYFSILLAHGEFFQAGMTDSYYVILMNNLKMFPIQSLEWQTSFDIMCNTPLSGTQQNDFNAFKKAIGVECNMHGLNLQPQNSAI